MKLVIEEPGKMKTEFDMSPGDSVRIKPRTKHRMIAVESCNVFEVSTSEVDDLIRLEDRYGRV